MLSFDFADSGPTLRKQAGSAGCSRIVIVDSDGTTNVEELS